MDAGKYLLDDDTAAVLIGSLDAEIAEAAGASPRGVMSDASFLGALARTPSTPNIRPGSTKCLPTPTWTS